MKYQFESETITTCDECPLAYVDWGAEDRPQVCAITQGRVWDGEKADDCPLTEVTP